MAGLTLEAADTPAAHAELAALARVIWHEHYPGVISRAQIDYMLGRGYRVDALAAQQAAGTRLTLARSGETACGFAAVTPDAADRSTAWLDKLYVHADARGTGVGCALIRRVAAQARDMGATTLRLRVNRHNTTSVAAYQRYGFVVEREDIKDIGHGYVMDDYLMIAPLAQVDANHPTD